MYMVYESVFPVLAEPTRRRILEELSAGDLAVGQLVEKLGVSQPTVSKHLKVLRDAELVSTRAEGQRRYYRLEAADLAAASEWFAPFVARATPEPAPTRPAALRPAAPVQPDARPHHQPAARETPAAAVVPASAGAEDGTGSKEFGRTVNATVEQVADRAQILLGRLPKPKFGRRR
ncbi:ArsR family transcriptional regulator [Zhihengliuella halotolerans]|uniref:ArsR family transcriptional regulator n=2 Tax=Zhihengliuella halotolerans TaxID=370736 RepID=A0A4Q8ADR8_9MICC|nr:ArsR family transcriptional regulator [Zhihengliuella halotolerans]